MSKPTAWELFNSCFKQNEDVVIIDDYDHIYQGKLKLYTTEQKEISFQLKSSRGGLREFNWVEVRFMSHDGFPVQKLFGADGSQSIEKLDTKNTQKIIRTILTDEYEDTLFNCDICNKQYYKKEKRKGRFSRTLERQFIFCNQCYQKGKYSGSRWDTSSNIGKLNKKFDFVFGDPFLIEGMCSQLFNAGNSGSEHWLEDTEECLVLTAKDGAKAQLFDLSTIYYFG